MIRLRRATHDDVPTMDRWDTDAGVILDTMRQVETFLLQRHYDGFLKKGRVRARSASALAMSSDVLSSAALMKLCIPILALFLAGIIIWAVKNFAL